MSYHVTIASFLLTAALFSCQKKTESKASTDDKAPIAVELSKIETTERSEPVFVAGTVASSEEARLSFKTAGIIQKINVREGQSVKKGQLLASLDLTEISAQAAQASISAGKAERDLNRIQKMIDDTAATLEQLQNAQTALDLTRQNVNLTAFNLSYSRISSPVDGVVMRKVLNEGELAGPGSVVLVVASNRNADWIIRVGVSDRDWARLEKGNKAKIRLDAYPDEYFSGQITEIGQTVDPLSRLYAIEVRLNPAGKRFANGLFGKVELYPSVNKVYRVIPVESLIEGHGKDGFVFVNRNGIARKIPVTIGYLDGHQILITKGLENIDSVISTGSAFLTDGARIVTADKTTKAH